MKVDKELFKFMREKKCQHKDLIDRWAKTRFDDVPQVDYHSARRTAIALQQQFKKNFKLRPEDSLLITDDSERAKRFRTIFRVATGHSLKETKLKGEQS